MFKEEINKYMFLIYCTQYGKILTSSDIYHQVKCILLKYD